jgi:uncharacterized protein (TIGR02996 family)
MNGVELLSDALTRDPGDDTAWLVLADALEEQSDVRAEVTRLSLWLRRELDHPEHPKWERQLREWLRRDVCVPLPHKIVILPGGEELELVLIPPGTFWMGSPENEPGRNVSEMRHRVTLRRAFWIGIVPVTQGQWRAVMGDTVGHFEGDRLPVEQVSWYGCRNFCRALSSCTEGRWRLPTEVEWEYACRAGTTTAYCYGDLLTGDLANCNAEEYHGRGREGIYRGRTTPVGSFTPNAWGLFDVHGNVWEWCAGADDPYPRGDVIARQDGMAAWTPGESVDVVLRGGGWEFRPRYCRSAARNSYHPMGRNEVCGFRVVMEA